MTSKQKALFDYRGKAIKAETYPNKPGHKTTETSKAAAQEVTQSVFNLRLMVIGALRSNPMTADEVANQIGKSVLSIRPRLSELKAMGAIYDSGDRRTNESGKNAIVWEVEKNFV